jgi:hypothetical protein
VFCVLAVAGIAVCAIIGLPFLIFG